MSNGIVGSDQRGAARHPSISNERRMWRPGRYWCIGRWIRRQPDHPGRRCWPASWQVSSDHPLCRYPKSDIIHPKVAFGLMGSAAGQYLSYCPATVRRNRCGSWSVPACV